HTRGRPPLAPRPRPLLPLFTPARDARSLPLFTPARDARRDNVTCVT
ncbi:MAG: hypothetical protein QOI45_1539, partial [Thermoleophilaceae bacterium]|nr:hypothetical protein [Thermoleophilaceae bacterium]